jgi:hypothetical protein
MSMVCFPSIPVVAISSVILITAAVAYRFVFRAPNNEESDENSRLLLTLLAFAMLSLAAFLAYVFIQRVGC